MEQIVDSLGEAMMKKQESNMGHVFWEAPLCCEVGGEVVEITFHEGIMTDWAAKYTCP